MFTSQNDVTMKGEGNFRLLQLLFVCLLGLCSSSKPHCLSDITLNDTAQLTVFSISAIILLNSQLTKYSVVFLTCCRSWSSQGESRDDDVLAVEKWLEVVFLIHISIAHLYRYGFCQLCVSMYFNMLFCTMDVPYERIG